MFLIFVYRNPPKVNPGLILVQSQFSREGRLIFGGGGGGIFERRIVLAERDQEL